jgi:hypothetical protein
VIKLKPNAGRAPTAYGHSIRLFQPATTGSNLPVTHVMQVYRLGPSAHCKGNDCNCRSTHCPPGVNPFAPTGPIPMPTGKPVAMVLDGRLVKNGNESSLLVRAGTKEAEVIVFGEKESDTVEALKSRNLKGEFSLHFYYVQEVLSPKDSPLVGRVIAIPVDLKARRRDPNRPRI